MHTCDTKHAKRHPCGVRSATAVIPVAPLEGRLSIAHRRQVQRASGALVRSSSHGRGPASSACVCCSRCRLASFNEGLKVLRYGFIANLFQISNAAPARSSACICGLVAFVALWSGGLSAGLRGGQSSPLQQLSIPDDPPTSGQRVHTISHLDHDISHSTKIRWQVCTATCHSFLCERPSATRSQSPSLGGGFHSGKLCAPQTRVLRASATSGWRWRKPGMRHGC